MSKTATEYKSKAVWFEVTMVQEFTRTVTVLAVDTEEAGEIAENRARRSRGMTRLGYSLGDVDVIEAKEVELFHGNRIGLVK
tara:strand:- start:290 stop:535 length:246 start_codon:yes stop_codon:yes gene_type:complete